VAFLKRSKTCKVEAFSYLLLGLAGSTSRVGNPLLTDFLMVGQKLEKLGFIYDRGNVIIVEPEEL